MEIEERRRAAGEPAEPQASHTDCRRPWVAVAARMEAEWRDSVGSAAVSESPAHGRLPANHQGRAALVRTNRGHANRALAPSLPTAWKQLDWARAGPMELKELVPVWAPSAKVWREVRPDGPERG